MDSFDPPYPADCDFGKWEQHGSYKRAFERLLRDLKAEQVRRCS